MSKCRSRFILAIALWALSISVLPTPGWVCPLSGRIGSADYVCANMGRTCAGHGLSCCHPVPVPAGETFAADQTPSLLAILSRQKARLVTPTVRALQPRPHEVAITAHPAPITLPRAPVMARVAPSFYLCAQHGPPPSSGRSPPRRTR